MTPSLLSTIYAFLWLLSASLLAPIASWAGPECQDLLDEDKSAVFNRILSEKYSGQGPIDVGHTVTLIEPETHFSFSQDVANSNDLNPDLRNFMEALKKESLSHPALEFREYGGFYIVYKDRSSKKVSFTSNLATAIHRSDHFKAMDSINLIEDLEGDQVEAIYHFHTHPGPEYRDGTDFPVHSPFLINYTDYREYQFLASFASYHAGRPIRFVGIVAPVCLYCSEVYFLTEAKPVESLIQEMRQKALKERTRLLWQRGHWWQAMQSIVHGFVGR